MQSEKRSSPTKSPAVLISLKWNKAYFLRDIKLEGFFLPKNRPYDYTSKFIELKYLTFGLYLNF